MKKQPAINDLLKVMAKLRSPKGCPWDREQTHLTLRRHAIEEVYELIDAIEARDDHEMAEELGDLLLQVVFHCQLARERGAFDFEKVCAVLVEKLIRRHPHVFGQTKVKNVDEVWTNWEKIKRAEKHGTKSERKSAFDGIPKHLPALLRAEKLLKKARKADLLKEKPAVGKISRAVIGEKLFDLAALAQARGWSAEELLCDEIKKCERALRLREKR
jgi:MazG family protein